MDFDLSDEQRTVRDAARKLLDDAATSERVRGSMGTGGAYDPELWQQMASQGWLALELPEDEGGLGLGFVEVAVLCEEIGRHVAPAPFLSNTLALWTLRHAALDDRGVGDVTRPWIEKLSSGEAVACVAWNGGVVVDAPAADIVITARIGEVRMHEFGDAKPQAEPAMDETRSVGWLDELPGEGVLLGGGELTETLLDRGAVAYSAEMLGCADRMLGVSVEYAKTREQFDRPIGAFQAVKHRLADMLVDVEGMRSAAYYGAWSVDTWNDDRSLAASTAKSWCSDASKRVLSSALQVHGGVGFTWEHDLHLYLKRAQLDQQVFGTAVFHRERIAQLLRERIESGADLW